MIIPLPEPTRLLVSAKTRSSVIINLQDSKILGVPVSRRMRALFRWRPEIESM